MNVIVINDFGFVNGGAGQVALSSVISLKERGINVIYFTAEDPIDPRLVENKIKVISTHQQDILSDKNRIRAVFQGLWNRKARRELSDLLSDYSISDTIVHVHGWMKAMSPSIFKALSAWKGHVVITLHDYFSICPNGGLYNYKKQRICNLNPGSAKCLMCNCDSRSYSQKVWRWIRNVIQQRVFKGNDLTFVSISKLNGEVVMGKSKYIKDENIKYIKNPVNIGVFENVESEGYYVFMGRLSTEKGARMFCQAISELNLKGVIIGDGALREELQNEYPNIVFKGWLVGEEKYDVLRRAKALVFPSLWYEGAPLTIAEAQSVGLPCIVPLQCAAAELIKNRETGFLFNIGDVKSLTSAIVEMEQVDEKGMKETVTNSFNPMEWSISVHTENLINTYQELLHI